MLNDHETTRQQPLLTEAPARRGAEPKRADDERITVTVAPWLKDQLVDLAAEDMPDVAWEDIVEMALSAGIGALSAAGFSRYLIASKASKAAPAAESPEPSCPFDRKHIPAFKALCAAAESGPLTLDAVAAEAITGRMGSASLRGIGTFLAGLARKSPVMGLRVEALGRKPGRVTMDYRLSREGSAG